MKKEEMQNDVNNPFMVFELKHPHDQDQEMRICSYKPLTSSIPYNIDLSSYLTLLARQSRVSYVDFVRGGG